MGNIAERTVKGPEMLSQSRMGIKVKGRSDLLCDPGDRYLLAVKFIVSVLEVMHGRNLQCLKCAKLPKMPKIQNLKNTGDRIQ